MPAISRIRFTNVVYENGAKRYNDETFLFDGHNSAILLENGGGKTVFIQTALQAIIPHINMADRKIKDTLSLENAPAHIAIEWIISDQPRRYALTATSLYIESNQLNSLKYTYDYGPEDGHGIEELPFSVATTDGKRPATRGEISDYYSRMNKQSINANVFSTIADYGKFIEQTYKIIPSEWRKVALINSGEGNVDEFFNKCKTTEQLLSNLLIPVVEEAIEGDNAQKFVETFERQREHFKKNRILQDKIEQSQLIKEKMDEYVAVYKQYEQQRLSLTKLKREVRGVAEFVKSQLEDSEEQLRFDEATQFAITQDQKSYEQKVKSFDLYCLEEQSKALSDEMALHSQKKSALESQIDQNATRMQNIEWTILHQDLSQQKEQIDYLKKELEVTDVHIEVEDLQKQLEENSSNIRGQYAYELELIERETRRLAEDLGKDQKTLTHQKDQLLAALDYEKDVISERSQLEAKLDFVKDQLSGLREQLFGDQSEVPLNLHRDTLKTQSLQVKKDRHNLEIRIDELKQYINTKSKALDNLQEMQGENKGVVIKLKEDLRRIDEKMSQIILDVEQSGYPLYLHGHLYGKEASILRELEEQRETNYQLKEKAVKEERSRARLDDLYQDVGLFMSDPLLIHYVEQIRDQVSFVKLGTDYLQTLIETSKLSEEALFQMFPYWAMSLVTSITDQPKVLDLLSDMDGQLMNAVFVLTREEVNQIIIGQDKRLEQLTKVTPKLWTEALNLEGFETWKHNIHIEASDAMMVRQQTETVFHQSDQLLKHCRRFFQDHPYEAYENIKEEINRLEAENKQMASDAKALDLGIKEDQDSLIKTSQQLSEIAFAQEKTTEAMRLVEQIEDVVAMERDFERNLKSIQKKYNDLMNNITQVQEICQQLEDRITNHTISLTKFKAEKERILKMDLYIEVEHYEPYGTNTSLEFLKQRRRDLKNQLAGISHTRLEIENRLAEHEQLVRRYEQDLKKQQHQALYPLERIEVYYDEEADDLFDANKALKSSLQTVETNHRKIDHQLTGLRTRCAVLREALTRDFDGVIVFEVESYHVKERLKVEKATLQDRQRKLNVDKKQSEQTLKTYGLLYRELEIKDGAYHFMGLDLEPLTLSKGDILKFKEQPEAHVRTILSQLDGQHKLTQTSMIKTKNKQESVLEQCRNQVTDRRLLETLVNGLGSKNDYQGLLIYQEKMTEIIMKIIKVAEDDKRESDLELQTFLSHLLTYVKSVAAELDVIQNKTKINVEDQVRQIFVFEIPQINDDEAKIHLRKYVDETIHFYEKESLHEDMNEETLRKSLVDRLSVMNLLNVVMNEEPIKIKCRKVTNDMKINKAPMVWESSNKWSGGEKWSKNMTLFLSILNYLAEKKQHLSASQKRHRSVILDNPFGKASSDHVLKPVFMIADKLGFQIIALTAHAEGKFISEYFPVVYSCRLRKTKDQHKQIMTNEKILNHTYLREHAPMTMMRMQEIEQMTLFDA